MTVVLNVRVDDELGAWVESYAKSRQVLKSVILRTAVEEFRAACEGGVPDLVAAPAAEPQPSTPASVRSLVDRHPGLQFASSLRRDPDAMKRQAKLNAAKERTAAPQAAKR